MHMIKRKSTVKNSRKEEYDIPQHLDLLNKWTIPKIPLRIIYQMGTFEKLSLKQVVKTTEETITIDSDHQTFRLLSENELAPYRDIYRFMHIGLDENSLSSLMLNVKLHGYDYMFEWVIEGATQPKDNTNNEVSEIEQFNDGIIPSRASTSHIRENYRCDNIIIDKDNIARPMPRTSSDLDIIESEMNFPDGIST
ncbi:hypothetical protein H5410_061406 [Solanum commersonii]|uniref:Uncharacterized protein n=1 Tax=Solanum commersonii TaxID=4109 RepID=A0A9J5W924_SOLCO|nr:hypothetical protein H5410_061406 [Solanum commersonii]